MVRKYNTRIWMYGFALMLFLLLCFVPGKHVFAKTAQPVAACVDDANLLSDEEEQTLTSQAEELSKKSGWNVFIVTCEDAQGKDSQTYGEDFFNSNVSDNRNGVVCLLDMDNRKIQIVTSGEAITYLTDKRINEILDASYDDVKNENYAVSLKKMTEGVADAYQKGIPDNAKIYNKDTGETTVYHRLTLADILIALAAGLGAGLIVFLAVMGRYRLKWGLYHYDYHQNSQMELHQQDDLLVNQIVTTRHIDRNQNGGGGGNQSTTSGGSGGDYGGWGQKLLEKEVARAS